MLTKDAIVEHYQNGRLEWHIPIEWHAVGAYRFHGDAVQYYPTGEVKLTRTYEHGVEVGEEIIYYRDGDVMSRLSFNKDGKKDGTYVYNHPDGTREEADYDGGEDPIRTRKFDKQGKEKKKKNDQPERGAEPGPKKILPGDHIPPSLLR